MSKVRYEFINQYGLPVMDDSPMDSEKADAYFRFLEEDMKKEGCHADINPQMPDSRRAAG